MKDSSVQNGGCGILRMGKQWPVRLRIWQCNMKVIETEIEGLKDLYYGV